MDSDPVDPPSSLVKRKIRVELSDSESGGDGSPPPRRSNGNGHVNGNGNGNGNGGSKRRRVTSADSDDEDQEDAAQRRGSKGKGRAVDGDEDDELDDEEDEGEGAVNHGRPLQPQYRPEYERHADGYVTGSITRIKLIDFMTYDFVEFQPGPHLNMILGPNGTGKSTIAAGIAIGLGFKPEIMGRATDLKSYVKQGKEVAWTEIQVRAPAGKRDHVIWRKFTREEKSEWKLNGTAVPRKTIIEIVGGFGIQANNLCCFLAQDRVAEFAKMSPPLTLKETMRAAGDPRLTDWHQKLVGKGHEKKNLEEKLNTDISKRDQVQTQMDKIRPDVEQFENRQNQEKEQEVLQLMVQAAKATVVNRKHEELSKKKEVLRKELGSLRKRNEPLSQLAKEHSKRETRSTDKVKKTNAELRDSLSNIKDTQGDLTAKLETCGRADDALANLKRKLRYREKTKQSMEDRKAKAEAKLQEGEDALGEEMKEQQLVYKELGIKERQAKIHRNSLQDKQQAMQRDLDRIGHDINTKMARQTQLEDVVKLRTEAAIAMNGSIGYALDFIEKNGARFEHPVGLPPAISVNVSRKEYAWQVEQCLTYAQRSTFICQSQHDYDLLVNLNHTEFPAKTLSDGRTVRPGKVGLHLVHVDVSESNVNPQRICSPQRMRELGLDGVAADYVEAEPIVVAYLNEHCRLHQAGVTQAESGRLNSQELGEAGFWTWLSRDESVRAIRSRYGQRKFQMTSQSANPAKFLNRVVDQQAVGQLVEEIAELKRRKGNCEAPLAQLREDMSKSAADREKISRDLVHNKKEIDRIRAELGEFETARTTIKTAQKELDRIASEPSEAEERDKLQAEKMTKALACLGDVNDLVASHAALATQASDSLTALLGLAQNKVNNEVISKKRVETERTEKRLERELKSVTEDVNRANVKYLDMFKKFGQEVKSRSLAVRDEVNARMARYPSGRVPLEETEEALAKADAELALSEGISSSIIERFRRFEKEHGQLVKEVKEQEEDLHKVTQSLTLILSKFEPALDSLVAVVSTRFSDAFERNGCSGDVRLDKDERGYEHWGLIPHVSFRDNETMQALTGSRQSGGERSYSTIMYLMALSEMARVPFSLVDEINQGMDQQAERTVFNQLVETTCDEGAGQYFLITPKLLVGLKYHERMKVLIVNNGHWLPEGTDSKQKFGDLRGCLKKFRRSIAAQ